MIITLHKSVNDLLSGEEVNQDFIDALEIIAHSLRFGNHILICDANTLKRISSLTGLSNLAIGVYRFLLGKFSFLYSYLQTFSRKLELTALEHDAEIINTASDVIIRMNIVRFAQYSILNPAILLSENIDDARFYYRLAELYMIRSGCRDKIKLTCEYRGGGGSTTYSEFEDIKTNQSRLCICIVDSDKKHPSSGFGDTAKKILDIDKSLQNPLCELQVINVHEAENLIPLEFIESISENEPHFIRLISYFRIIIRLLSPIQQEDFFKHYDFKKGINYKKLICTNNNFSRYWLNVINLIGATYIDTNDTDITCYCHECDLAKCRFSVLPGFGDRLISLFLDNQDKNVRISTKIEQLPQYLKTYWNEIGKLVSSWCCSLPPIVSH